MVTSEVFFFSKNNNNFHAIKYYVNNFPKFIVEGLIDNKLILEKWDVF